MESNEAYSPREEKILVPDLVIDINPGTEELLKSMGVTLDGSRLVYARWGDS